MPGELLPHGPVGDETLGEGDEISRVDEHRHPRVLGHDLELAGDEVAQLTWLGLGVGLGLGLGLGVELGLGLGLGLGYE